MSDIGYASSGGFNIAYTTFGEGSLDLVFVPGMISNVELIEETPLVSDFFDALASFSRTITFDKRGTGMSDRVSPEELPTLEERVDDITAVMEAAGSARATVVAFSEGSQTAALFASMFPERTNALVLLSPAATFRRKADHLGGAAIVPERFENITSDDVKVWGKGEMTSYWLASLKGIEAARKSQAKWERMSATPGAVLALAQMYFETDIRPILPQIRVPTLVIARREDAFLNPDAPRAVAGSIPGARLVELDGVDHAPWVPDPTEIPSIIAGFVAGKPSVGSSDRILASVLFTDVVGSTQDVVRRGDQRWARLLSHHDAISDRVVRGSGGRIVNRAGDGMLATLPGPARAIACAKQLIDEFRPIGIEIRAGIHVGEVERRGDELAGVAVHIGARVSSLAEAGEILVSQTTKELVFSSGFQFTEHGEHELKGVPGKWRLFSVDA